ncbi:TIR domain-containing protein [Aureispira sp. CCB-E]|uniref:TIR domain-containing protein n=1 Tax=Aureispira sp. CCB-E TaxID=3051121 RepID=UPI00286909B7|nr:TIR domain-containing protein [Aureispira sp. CCB-E]WMX17557.1 TIR domain-containing protein [Aureispira sp. CCB-E]
MSRTADYFVSKLKWKKKGVVESFLVHSNDYASIDDNGIERQKSWVIQQLRTGKIFRCIHKNEQGQWCKGAPLTLSQNFNSKDNSALPLILPRRKSFISYYHKDNQTDKEHFKHLTTDLIVNKSVEDGDIKSDLSDEYIKQLILKGYLKDTTVLILLLGNKTKCRKHIDWEISGALNLKVGDGYAGVLGLILPSHPDYNTGKYTSSKHPQRFIDNVETGYAIIRNYTTDRKKLQEYIELAFANRKAQADKRINSRPQMKKNTCT